MRRRAFLKGAGVVCVLVAGGAVWRAHEQGIFSVGEGPAYEPWRNWRSEPGEGALGMVRAAILAASPHNTQPWLFRVSPTQIELYADIGRNVGALDPFLREQHIGLGCALENLVLAARANGFETAVTIPEGKLVPIPVIPEPELVAVVDLLPGSKEQGELYDAIPHRHTNRNPYDPQRPVPAAITDAVRNLTRDEADVRVFLFAGDAERKKIVEMIATANRQEYSDPEVGRDSHQYFRTNWSAIQKYRDGLTMDAAGISAGQAAIAKFIPERVLQRVISRAQDGYFDLLQSAPLFGTIAVHDRYDRAQSVSAGRMWQRAHLLATARGVAARPCNEAVEFTDHQRLRGQEPSEARLLEELTGDATWEPTFMFYMGYAMRPGLASPRRPVEEVRLGGVRG